MSLKPEDLHPEAILGPYVPTETVSKRVVRTVTRMGFEPTNGSIPVRVLKEIKSNVSTEVELKPNEPIIIKGKSQKERGPGRYSERKRTKGF